MNSIGHSLESFRDSFALIFDDSEDVSEEVKSRVQELFRLITNTGTSEETDDIMKEKMTEFVNVVSHQKLVE